MSPPGTRELIRYYTSLSGRWANAQKDLSHRISLSLLVLSTSSRLYTQLPKPLPKPLQYYIRQDNSPHSIIFTPSSTRARLKITTHSPTSKERFRQPDRESVKLLSLDGQVSLTLSCRITNLKAKATHQLRQILSRGSYFGYLIAHASKHLLQQSSKYYLIPSPLSFARETIPRIAIPLKVFGCKNARLGSESLPDSKVSAGDASRLQGFRL